MLQLINYKLALQLMDNEMALQLVLQLTVYDLAIVGVAVDGQRVGTIVGAAVDGI